MDYIRMSYCCMITLITVISQTLNTHFKNTSSVSGKGLPDGFVLQLCKLKECKKVKGHCWPSSVLYRCHKANLKKLQIGMYN